MLKKILFGLAIASFTIIPLHPVNAQRDPNRVPLSDPYQEYIYNLNQFYSDRKEYENARSKYLSYQTEQSKADAINATKTMLESGRIALLQYIALVRQYLSEQEELSQRVKNAVLQDLQSHQEFLTNSQGSINEITDFSKAKDAADALNLRFGYVKTTATQALNYADAVTTKKQLDEARNVVTQFSAIITGYPDDNRSKNIVNNWITEITADITSSENNLNIFIEGIYPLPTETTERAGYELGNTGTIDQLNRIKAKVKGYSSKFKEMNSVIKKAYMEL